MASLTSLGRDRYVHKGYVYHDSTFMIIADHWYYLDIIPQLGDGLSERYTRPGNTLLAFSDCRHYADTPRRLHKDCLCLGHMWDHEVPCRLAITSPQYAARTVQSCVFTLLHVATRGPERWYETEEWWFAIWVWVVSQSVYPSPPTANISIVSWFSGSN